MKKYLILKYEDDSVFFPYLKETNLERIYKIKNDFLIKLCKKLNIIFMILGSWKKNIKNIDKVILFDTGYHPGITKYIKKKNPKCKIIFYYWNVVNEYNKRPMTDYNIDEVWTFDENDAKKHHMNYNPQFYTKKLVLENDNVNNNILFLGRDKGRKLIIQEIQNFCLKQEIKTEFIIIEQERDIRSYQEYLKLLERSNCILDILAPGQSGMTLRCMESLFLKKKLITNNKDIVNCDFYDKNNIFIIGNDDLLKLKDFLNLPYKDIKQEIIDYYDYENWLKRFL